jgi:hypothetical protein
MMIVAETEGALATQHGHSDLKLEKSDDRTRNTRLLELPASPSPLPLASSWSLQVHPTFAAQCPGPRPVGRTSLSRPGAVAAARAAEPVHPGGRGGLGP